MIFIKDGHALGAFIKFHRKKLWINVLICPLLAIYKQIIHPKIDNLTKYSAHLA